MSASTLRVGDSRTTRVVEDLKRTQLVQYAGASGDYHPLHSDEVFATEIGGYKSIFAHGMLTMGMTGRAVTDFVGAGRLAKYGAQFRGQVWPGDTLDTTVTVTALREEGGRRLADLTIATVNQHGAEVLAGWATARIDE
ncbi:MAG: MaoC/PaaZ C-terminal domain-containing protein [Ramlibacter sp.]